MKKLSQTLTVLCATGLLMSATQVSAESTYGYNSAGTGTVEATAKVKVTVTVPKLILLRVGAEGATVDDLTFTAAGNINTAPGASLGTTGDSKAATWDGVAPTFANPTDKILTAYAWTNALGGGTLTCSTTADAQFTAAEGLTSNDVSVKSVGTLDHPGTTTACSGPDATFAKNTLVSSTWTYSILGTTLANAAAGTHIQTTTYTATAL